MKNNLLFPKIVIYLVLIIISYAVGSAIEDILSPFGWFCGSVMFLLSGGMLWWIDGKATGKHHQSAPFARQSGYDEFTQEEIEGNVPKEWYI